MSEPSLRDRAIVDGLRLVTDLRSWAALGLFLLTWHLFDMIGDKPALTSNQGFMFLTQALVVTGFVGGVIAFLFVASKADVKPPAPAPTEPQNVPGLNPPA